MMTLIVNKFHRWLKSTSLRGTVDSFRIVFAAIWLIYDLLDISLGETVKILWFYRGPFYSLSVISSQVILIFCELGLLLGWRPRSLAFLAFLAFLARSYESCFVPLNDFFYFTVIALILSQCEGRRGKRSVGGTSKNVAAWPRDLLVAQTAWIYFASAFLKLNPFFLSGGDLYVRQNYEVAVLPLYYPEFYRSWISTLTGNGILAGLAVTMEMSLALILLSWLLWPHRRHRLHVLASCLALGIHGYAAYNLNVFFFGASMIAQVFFLTSTKDRGESLEFDHCYQHISSVEEYDQLGKRGFFVNETPMVEHPGALQCRFLRFHSATQELGERVLYLEFICNYDAEIYRQHRASKGESVDPHLMFEPGFSLRAKESLEDFYKKKRDLFWDEGIKFFHRNYDWKANPLDRLPGWNFVDFKKNIFPEINVWLTEYESVGKRQSGSDYRRHMNTCVHFKGFVWKKNDKGMKNMSSLMDLRFQDGKILMKDGISLWVTEPTSALGKEFAGRKAYPFWAAVLTCSDFHAFKKEASPDKIVEFEGRPAGLIQMGSRGWDILVVEM